MPTAAKKTINAKKDIKVHNTYRDDGSNNLLPITFGSDIFTQTTVEGVQYYPFFAPNDRLPRTLLEASLLSPTLANCIHDKTLYTVGDGLQVKDQEFPTAFDKRINHKRETLDDVIKDVAESVYVFGNMFIEISRVEFEGEKFVFVNTHNPLDCRLMENKDGSDPTHVIRSKQFRNEGYWTWKKEEKPVIIPLWVDTPGAKCWLKKGGVERTMLHIKNKIQGIDTYGMPSYYAGLLNVLMEHRATSFNLDNFDNNMFIAGLLLIEGGMTDPEEKKLLQKMKRLYTGQGKNQRILPIHCESGLGNTKFVPLNDTRDGHFMEFDNHNEDKIISANSWSKAIMDLKETSGLGKGGEYLKQLFRIKFRTVISPTQQILMNNFIFPLMQIIDDWKGTKFYDLPWYIKPVIPVSLEGVLDINSLMTVDEGREEIGLAPLEGENGKKMIKEIGVKPKEEKPPKNKKEDTK